MDILKTGLQHTSTLLVDEGHTALALGSGDLQVLATPAMCALMENAAMLAVAGCLDETDTTVGGFIESSHLVPTAVGAKVEATATLTEVSGRRLSFEIEARQGDVLIGKGTHVRFIVNREKFMSKL